MSRYVVVGLAIGTLAGSASAGIIGVKGHVEMIDAPADARLNVLTSNTTIRAWNEQQDIMLDRALSVDAAGSGKYDEAAELVHSTIDAGTVVSSQYIHFDSVESTHAHAWGRIRFDADILGIICVGSHATGGTLGASDFLSSGTIYDDSPGARGLELTEHEFFRISKDRRSVFVSLGVSGCEDDIRVITTAAPTPGTATLVGIGAAFMCRRRRGA